MSFNPTIDDYEDMDDYDDEMECGWPGCGCCGSDICLSIRDNGTMCPECASEYVQVQNGDWVCPDCDLWL
jgi:hypothetical protein